jgi:hypothetical protein
MDNLPSYIYWVFGLTLLLAVSLFYIATNYSKTFLIIISLWITAQAYLSLSGFYKIANTFPPRFALLLLPPLVMTIVLFNTVKGKQFIDTMKLDALTLFHIIRVPVELVLFWLFANKTVPELMTFEGRNFDILSGISAPVIFYFGFVKKNLNKSILLIWNFIGLALLLNIAFNAILSLPGLFQQFALEQPNIAILYFPFVLLPAVLVPLVLFSHLVTIRQLLSDKNF